MAPGTDRTPTRGTIITTAPARPRRTRRAAGLLAASTGLGVVLTALTAGAASAATPFTPDQLQYPYPSNATYDYVPIIDQFTQLRADRPDIIALNDSQTVAINQAATDLESERAIIDQYDDMSVSMHDGMGERVGTIYRDARLAGELPKTQALLAKSGGLIGYYSSSNPAKQHFSYDRPYIRFPELLEYRDKEGGDAWGSTSGAYPSGHTSQAYWQGTALATMLPELAPQILARTSEAGHNRIVMAAHYPLDVMSGRMMGQHIVERRWSDPEFRVLLEEASAELHTVLEAGCGVPLAECIAADTPYLPEDEALAAYEARLSYAFPQIAAAGQPVTVPENAESLLLTSHPDLTPEQRRQVLALTAIDSGYPLDKGAEGSWQRLDLAAAMAADVTVAADGTVSLVAAPAPVDPAPAPEPEPGPAPVDPTPGEPGTAPAPGDGDAGTDPVDTAPVAVEPATPAGGAATGTAAGRDPQAVAPTASGRDGLAYTGSDALLGVAGAALALLGGGTALVLRRRRASARS